MFYGFVVTEAGNRLLAQMVAGETLELTRVVMDKGTAESAESARALTAPLEAMVEGTTSVPLVEKNTVNLIVEYRSDLNGGLTTGFWIGGFGIYAKDPSGGSDIMLYYGSLGDEKQYVRAYTQGVPPDVRRYPVSITLTEGVGVTVAYPADAWMNAQDVADYFNATLKPELLEEIKLQTDAMTGRVDELELLVNTKETPAGAQTKADAVQSNLNSHTGSAEIHVTQADKDGWSAKETPDGAQAKIDTVQANLISHTGNKSNPHGVTASQVGAATSSSLTSHTGNKSNPHGVTASQVGAATTSSLTSHTGNKSNPHSVTAAQVGAAQTLTLTATLSTSWSGSAPCTQTVSVSGMLASDNPIIDVVLSSDIAASKLLLKAWGNVSRITTASGSITAYCYEERPVTSIPIQMKVVRS